MIKTMKFNKYKILILLTVVSLKSFGMGFRATYLHIDSLTQNQIGAKIYLDLMDKKIDFSLRGQKYIFNQNYHFDSTEYYAPKLLELENSETKSYLTIDRLIDILEDSIFVSADYIKTDLKGKKVMDRNKIERLGINKSDLKGVIIGPTKKQSRKFFIGGSLISILILTIMIITGGQ